MARAPATVAVVMFDRAPLFETSVPISVYGVDRYVGGAPTFTLLPVAAEPGPLTTTGGIPLHAPHELDAIHGAGIVIVPSWRNPRERPPERVMHIDTVARQVGLTSAVSLRPPFRRLVGVSPQEYRSTFRLAGIDR